MTEQATLRDRAPKFGPDDVRLMLAYSAATTGGNRRVALDAELAATGDRLFMLEMNPDQFADLIASRATVAGSRIPVAVPSDGVRQIGEGPLCTRCLVPTTWNLDTQVWDHAEDYTTSDRATTHAEHHATFVPQLGPQWLAVTLTATTNPYLTVPCEGLVQVNEYATDGTSINASFRRRNPDGSHSAPVHIGDPEWIYRGTGPTSRTLLSCPDPAAHASEPEPPQDSGSIWFNHRVRTYLRNRGVSAADTFVIRTRHRQGGPVTSVQGVGMDPQAVVEALDTLFAMESGRVVWLVDGTVQICWGTQAPPEDASDGHEMLTLTVRATLSVTGFPSSTLRVTTNSHGGGRYTTTIRPKSTVSGWTEDYAQRLFHLLTGQFPEASVTMTRVRDLITIAWPG